MELGNIEVMPCIEGRVKRLRPRSCNLDNALFLSEIFIFSDSSECAIGRCSCAMNKYRKDEGRPLGVGLQELAPNHLKLQW